jgi:hypothetical protein
MSTRATYLFKTTNEFDPDTCLYIHHDGYPEGAANYFLNAFSAGGVDVCSMIRGNDGAEMTGSHETHGDTEFRYTIEGLFLTVDERVDFETNTFKTMFCGDWVDFINEYVPKSDGVDDFQPLKRIDLGHWKNQAHTPATLNAILQDELATCGHWTCNEDGKPQSFNLKAIILRIKIMKELLSTFGAVSWRKAA